MAPRLTLDQIMEWKQRRGRAQIGIDFTSQIDELARAWESKSTASFSDFVFIRLSTLIEVFVRETVRSLVDADDIYLDRADALLKETKLDRILAKHLRGQILTIGDIAAHGISLSNLDKIIAVFETLMPGFRDALPTVTERWIEDAITLRKPIIDNPAEVLAAVNNVLRIRNILVHEIPSEKPYVVSKIGDYLKACLQFVSAVDWHVTGLLSGDVPRTQTQMNISAGQELAAESEALEKLIREIIAKGEVDSSKLRASQDAWQSYADAEATLRASLVEGGTMFPMVWAGEKVDLTRARIKALYWCSPRARAISSNPYLAQALCLYNKSLPKARLIYPLGTRGRFAYTRIIDFPYGVPYPPLRDWRGTR